MPLSVTAMTPSEATLSRHDGLQKVSFETKSESQDLLRAAASIDLRALMPGTGEALASLAAQHHQQQMHKARPAAPNFDGERQRAQEHIIRARSADFEQTAARNAEDLSALISRVRVTLQDVAMPPVHASPPKSEWTHSDDTASRSSPPLESVSFFAKDEAALQAALAPRAAAPVTPLYTLSATRLRPALGLADEALAAAASRRQSSPPSTVAATHLRVPAPVLPSPGLPRLSPSAADAARRAVASSGLLAAAASAAAAAAAASSPPRSLSPSRLASSFLTSSSPTAPSTDPAPWRGAPQLLPAPSPQPPASAYAGGPPKERPVYSSRALATLTLASSPSAPAMLPRPPALGALQAPPGDEAAKRGGRFSEGLLNVLSPFSRRA